MAVIKNYIKKNTKKNLNTLRNLSTLQECATRTSPRNQLTTKSKALYTELNRETSSNQKQISS